MTALGRRGQRLSPRARQRQADLLHQVLPRLAHGIQTEGSWSAPAATLDDARKAGHDPAALLADATRRGELYTADSISDVLIWRLRRSAHPPALPESPHDTSTRANRRTTPPAPTTPTATSGVNDSSRKR
ncbi:relaxase [Streptomyces sp. NPDC002701]|uniref:relaxase n=1 Tax=Streptomyces sp. NPDC002701 TaxID=3364661 RepID=UPI0036A96655